MKPLGTIVRLQLQRYPLKRMEGDKKVYDPAAILPVTELTLTKAGACVRTADGSFLIDVHNAAHPATRNNGGVNPVSFLFTHHYDRMQERFGAQLTTGCAGESILIEASRLVSLAEVAAGVVIEAKTGPVTLGSVIVAAPCAAFSRYALRDPDASADALKPVLQFLDDGMRGFYCQLDSEAPATIELGAKVFAAS